jgi:superfamily II DNA or RNA helicase
MSPPSKWKSFEDARGFVHSLGLKTKAQWESWSSTEARPDVIPKNPWYAYREEWKSWGDWLGTNSVRPADKVFWPFQRAHAYVLALGFTRVRQYTAWKQAGNKPDEIPSIPERIYEDNWIDWPHWLTGTPAPKFYPFEIAREKVRALNLKTEKEFRLWCKQEGRDKAIPANPAAFYGEEFEGLGDWLGTGRTANQDIEYWDFERAKAYARSLGLGSGAEWFNWYSSKDPSINIPKHPESVYLDWSGWGDWLGTGRVASQNMTFLPFEEARDYMRSLCLKNQREFNEWKKSPARPSNIPSNPYAVYEGDFKGLNDYLGTTPTSHGMDFLPFKECVDFIRRLGLTSQDDFLKWARSGNRPANVPASPYKVYEKEWRGYGHFLGIYNRWTKVALVSFLKSLLPILSRLEPSELFAILRKNNCLSALDSLGENNPLVMITRAALNGEQGLVAELSNSNRTFEAGPSELQDHSQDEVEVFESDDSVDTEVSSVDSDREEASLPNLSAREILDALDEVSTSLGISDEETINFLVDKGVSRLWQSVLGATDQRAEVEKARAFSSDNYAQTIRDRFIEEFDLVEAIPIPNDYAFAKAGKPVVPNLMQRLIAHRLTSMKRVGNWSGTGAGKTLAAVLGSRVVDSEITLVIALNNTINDPDAGWALEIKSAFPRSHIQIKERGDYSPKQGSPNYLLLNYESFQLDGSRSMVEHLVRDHRIDLIVLDEIHSAKSRNAVESKRRQLLNYLITESGKNNPDLKVLGMSATPVVNSLDEAASLLEMITSKDYSDLDTRATISNALGIHQQLILNGVRYRPNYKMELHEEAIEIRADGLTDQILNLRKGDVLGLENILLEPKLPCILDLAKPGTIVFSNFVDGIFDAVSTALKGKGLKVARFSGEDKSGLEEFKRGKADILVGSSALGTGVDGLQYICDRLIIVTLPWTSAGYEQLLGRIYRQGSRFERIEVFIPQIVLNYEGQEWSWDKQRFGRIKYKKTLADAAVDGFVPEGKLMSQEKMFAEARKILQEWISALEDGGSLSSIARPDLKVPMPPEQLQTALRKYGDFSQMNARIGSSASETTNRRFNESSDEWYLYHSLYKEARKSWIEVPYAVIAESLAKRPDWIIGDFGCGEALLSTIIPNKVYNFDHVAINESVEACDMMRTSLPDETLDVAVFSLSLMGLNWSDYIREAHRVLRPGGFIEIAEPASKWEEGKLEQLKSVIEKPGFQLVGQPRNSQQFIYLRAVKV